MSPPAAPADPARGQAAVGALIAALVGVHVLGALWYAERTDLPWLDALLGGRGPRFRVAVGGQHAALVDRGQTWRLFTSVLLHGDALHLSVNAASLWVLGRWLAPMVGGLRFLAWFAVGGVVGSVASQLAGVRQSDGASGAAYALLGALLVLAWRRRATLDAEERRLLGPVLLGLLALNLLISIFLPFIDLFGHLGGLAAGLVLGASARARPGTVWLDGAVVLGFVGVCVWGWGWGR